MGSSYFLYYCILFATISIAHTACKKGAGHSLDEDLYGCLNRIRSEEGQEFSRRLLNDPFLKSYAFGINGVEWKDSSGQLRLYVGADDPQNWNCSALDNFKDVSEFLIHQSSLEFKLGILFGPDFKVKNYAPELAHRQDCQISYTQKGGLQFHGRFKNGFPIGVFLEFYPFQRIKVFGYFADSEHCYSPPCLIVAYFFDERGEVVDSLFRGIGDGINPILINRIAADPLKVNREAYPDFLIRKFGDSLPYTADPMGSRLEDN